MLKKFLNFADKICSTNYYPQRELCYIEKVFIRNYNFERASKLLKTLLMEWLVHLVVWFTYNNSMIVDASSNSLVVFEELLE